jgi:hypothetical protein
MYFLYKEGMYGHGVFWIGEDLEVGKQKADEAATNDVDNYHEWQVLELNSVDLSQTENVKCDPKNKVCYIGKRAVESG